MRALRIKAHAFVLFLLAALWLLGGAVAARACSCGVVKPCEAFGNADAVFVGTVGAQREVERDVDSGDGHPFKGKFQISLFHVEEAFAGPGGEVEVETELNTSCGFPLTGGARYLVYAYKGAERFSTGMCTRTARVEHAAEDLEYLRGNAGRSGAILEGVVAYESAQSDNEREPPGADTVGVKAVVAEGEGRRAEARVGPGGRYRFEGLPPGKYRVNVSLPDELTVDDPYDPDIAEELGIKDQSEVEVPTHGCVVHDIAVADNGRLSGRVTDAEGLPVVGLKVELRRPRERTARDGPDDEEDDEEPHTRTDEDGRYFFKGVPAGRYLVGVRLGRYIDPEGDEAAFRSTFYPGVANERDAVVVGVGRGQSVAKLDFQLGPRLRERVVSGVVVRADGRPTAGASVRYQARTRDRKRSSLRFIKTDERGRFSFKSYEGTAFLVGAFIEGCKGEKCVHAHEAEVAPTGPTPRLRLVLNQPGSTCSRCRDYDKFEEGKP